ncbi:hypothetical protein [Streptomyces sp. NPDC047928]|uniref:hypothetical protein n=1 Tax=unclassified Streptomyces TaxID=2593676 RepID=UPI0037181933
MTSTPSRRRLFGQAVAAVGGAILMGRAGRAYAVPRSATQAQHLPTVGQTFSLSVKAFGAKLVADLPPPPPMLDFNGSLVQKVVAGGDDFVRLQTLRFTMEAFHPMFGKITLAQPDDDVPPASTLALGSTGFTETWVQPFNTTFERNGEIAGPFVFQTLEPARWVANLAQYPPPSDALFESQAPIRLGAVSSDGEQSVYGELQGMNVNQG